MDHSYGNPAFSAEDTNDHVTPKPVTSDVHVDVTSPETRDGADGEKQKQSPCERRCCIIVAVVLILVIVCIVVVLVVILTSK